MKLWSITLNYLAHLHIAKKTNTSYIGNLLGDFVKGGLQYLDFDDDIKRGIALHRAVDVFTDEHAFVSDLKRTLGEHRRYGGIVLDVFFDHQLASRFERFDDQTLQSFSVIAYQGLSLTTLQTQGVEFPERFCRVVNGMTRMDWLTGYQHEQNVERALVGISQRLKRPVDLTLLMPWYQQNHTRIEQGFNDFYEELIDFSKVVSK